VKKTKTVKLNPAWFKCERVETKWDGPRKG
jgi:hypothetical protein